MKTMNFKSTCKFCGVSNLAWQQLTILDTKKWVLFKNETEKHKCLSSAKKAEVKADETVKKPLKVEDLQEAFDKAKKAGKGIIKPSKKQIAFKKSLHKKMEAKLDEEAKNILVNKLPVIKVPVDYTPGKSNDVQKVKLYDATKLYQPVSASSAGSTYFVVAMWDGLNMACRIKTYAGYYTVSIRVEGLKYEKWKNLDMLSKFNHSPGYGSNHYNAKTIVEVRALIYAFIGMINKPVLTSMPDISKIL